MKKKWNNRIAQQLVSYESMFKLLDDILLHDDIQTISSIVAKQWKYIANVTSWHLIIAHECEYCVIDGYRGEASISMQESLSPWDSEHLNNLLPRQYTMETLKQRLMSPPEHLSGTAIAEIFVLPFIRSDHCIGLLSASIRHTAFSELDRKFIRIFGNHLTDKIHNILFRQSIIKSLHERANRDALTGLLNRRAIMEYTSCLLYKYPSPRDLCTSRMPSSD
jgi:hypothetical protein